jgi:hypothetical protein
MPKAASHPHGRSRRRAAHQLHGLSPCAAGLAAALATAAMAGPALAEACDPPPYWKYVGSASTSFERNARFELGDGSVRQISNDLTVFTWSWRDDGLRTCTNLSPATLSDGTSNTVVFGERCTETPIPPENLEHSCIGDITAATAAGDRPFAYSSMSYSSLAYDGEEVIASYVTTCVAKMAIRDPAKSGLTQRAPDVACLREQIWPEAE